MAAKIPWQWQVDAKTRFAVKEIMSIVADCGTGKTLAAIMIAQAKNMPNIVIAPVHGLCRQWERDIKETLGEGEDVWVYNKSEEHQRGDRYREEFDTWLKT
jgi:superfamily II DNA or RNA helicase